MATITGSTTMGRSGVVARRAASPSRTVVASSADASMPTFTASRRMSLVTASSWAVTNSGGVASTPVTPVVFWAVRATITLMP